MSFVGVVAVFAESWCHYFDSILCCCIAGVQVGITIASTNRFILVFAEVNISDQAFIDARRSLWINRNAMRVQAIAL